MSLLMDALKKAERAKQEQSDLPGDTLEMQTPSEALEDNFGLPPTGHRPPSNDEKSEFPPTTSAVDTSAMPELTLMSSSAQDDTPAHNEPAPADQLFSLAEPTSTEEHAPKKPEPAPAAVNQNPATAPSDTRENWVQLDDVSNPVSADNARRTAPHTDSNPKNVRDEQKIALARQKAKSIFATKQPARSRTLLLTGAAAAIVIGGATLGFYYWQILSSHTSTLPTGMPPQVAMQGPPPPPATPITDSAPPSNGGPPPPSANLTPSQAPPMRDSTASQPASLPERKPVPAPHTENPAIQIRLSSATNQLNPMLAKAYQSFLAGDTEIAQQQYSKALQQEPNNRDALLGLAATALNRKQPEQAAAYYLKLLDLNPADPDALAGLVGLQGQTDPTQSESRLKKILAQNPQAAAIHFALGNVYTQQSRWAEAQQSFFRAYSNTPTNADYVFNLAVSLDHLGQSKLALEYYQRALSLSGPANFDKTAAQSRAMELQQPTGN